MDPISFTASLITIIGVSITSAKKFADVVHNLKTAPEELHKLLSEVNDLNYVLSELRNSCQDPSAQQLPTVQSGLGALVDKARTLHGDLEQLTKNVKSNTKLPNRLAWLKMKRKATSLRDEFYVLKIHLLTTISAKNL